MVLPFFCVGINERWNRLFYSHLKIYLTLNPEYFLQNTYCKILHFILSRFQKIFFSPVEFCQNLNWVSCLQCDCNRSPYELMKMTSSTLPQWVIVSPPAPPGLNTGEDPWSSCDKSFTRGKAGQKKKREWIKSIAELMENSTSCLKRQQQTFTSQCTPPCPPPFHAVNLLQHLQWEPLGAPTTGGVLIGTV